MSHNTTRAWLSVLEASFVVFRVPNWHRNLRKRTVKAAKLHLVDAGLACYLLGIRAPEQIQLHPLRGALFESWVAANRRSGQRHTVPSTITPSEASPIVRADARGIGDTLLNGLPTR